jgi:hypothetical protein
LTPVAALQDGYRTAILKERCRSFRPDTFGYSLIVS